MALKMRPTGLSSGFYKNTVDYSVLCGEWCLGRICDNRTGPEHMRWFWALHAPSKPGTPTHLEPSGDARIGKGGIRGKLERMESLGETGRGAIAGTTTNLICLAAFPLGAFSPARYWPGLMVSGWF
jgi:hypothetical protein